MLLSGKVKRESSKETQLQQIKRSTGDVSSDLWFRHEAITYASDYSISSHVVASLTVLAKHLNFESQKALYSTWYQKAPTLNGLNTGEAS